MKNKKIKIYLIARISKDAHLWNNKVTSVFDKTKFEIFKPQEHNPWNKKHESFSQKVVDIDIKAIKDSHLGLILPEFGKDCAWECGYYANSSKPTVIFVDDQLIWLRDWMIKGGINFMITNNQKTYKVLKQDHILKDKKIILIKKLNNLNETLINIYENNYRKNKK